MPAYLIGIENVGEFFSHHYLDSLLDSDLKPTLERWNAIAAERQQPTPERALAGLGQRYYAAIAEAQSGRTPVDRWRPLRGFYVDLLHVLGFEHRPAIEPVEPGGGVPVLLTEERDGHPHLWVLDAPLPLAADGTALDEVPLPEQGPDAVLAEAVKLRKGRTKVPAAKSIASDAGGVAVATVSKAAAKITGHAPRTRVEDLDALAYPLGDDGAPLSWGELIEEGIFRLQRPPRWLLFLAGADVLLIDRTKWGQGRYLRFQLGEILSRAETKTLRATVGLLHKDALNPATAAPVHDALDEQSHRHAYAVSTDLKHGARRAVELLANEAVYHKRQTAKQKVFGQNQALADGLKRDCLRYLYRLLFLFYAEARGREAGVTPMDADPYRLGYSLESLRDLELVPLSDPAAQDGYFIHHSLEQLFSIVNRGFPTGAEFVQKLLAEEGPGAGHDTFEVTGLRSPLFDPERTPSLHGVKFRNRVLQEVLRLLSLSREGNAKRPRGRISYAHLGINQIGAVYEGLLAYSGFFAEEDLYEVSAEGDDDDGERRSFFVPKAELTHYKEEQVVREASGQRKVYKKGSYVFRLAGRDREKSASYYTPEVLTQCLTKYTLKERLEDLSADEILSLTVLEPAMGSGAFLVEAVNQLADAYLEKLRAAGTTIPIDTYAAEKRKVAGYITTRNVYGVDLNPLAADLGKISLWLNMIRPGARAPYLDARIAVGNSLLGARRDVFSPEDLTAAAVKEERSWLDKTPTHVALGSARPMGSVYAFLLPDRGLVPFDADKVVKGLEPNAVQAIKTWRSSFTKPFESAEVKRWAEVSDRIDGLWLEHAKARRAFLAAVDDGAEILGRPGRDIGRPHSAEACEEAEKLHLGDPRAAGQRLRRLMDYASALWFWPIRSATSLPSRAEWLEDAEAILEGGELADGTAKRLEVVAGVAERVRFHHWELAFPEVFLERSGFDVILGNPPWINLGWNEQDILSDFDPRVVTEKLSAKQAADRREGILAMADARATYLEQLEVLAGSMGFLGSVRQEPLLQGMRLNIYKCFITQSLRLGSPKGIIGMLHDKGLYDGAGGGLLRRTLSRRLRWHFQFKNELRLFEAISNQKIYGVTIAATQERNPFFRQISNLFHPRTIAESLHHDGQGPVPDIKSDEDKWDLRGHASRIVPVDTSALSLFARLYDEPGTHPLEARLPVVHSSEILNVLKKLAAAPRKLSSIQDRIFSTQHFNETGSQEDGTIRRKTKTISALSEWVLSGPHFYVARPFNKTPNPDCKSQNDYSTIDLDDLPDNYLPRTNYVRACSEAEYLRRTPHWKGRPITEFYRHVNRKMIVSTNERTLVPAIIPPGPAHIVLVFSIAFDSLEQLVLFSGACSSLPADFLAKASGKGDALLDLLANFPIPGRARSWIIARTLQLNCLTNHYADLWQSLFTSAFTRDTWAKDDPRLPSRRHLKKTWSRDTPLRTAYARRQALVELDALVALDLGLTADELITIYRVQFPVLRQYERETYYDQRGRIVFTTNRGLAGVGLKRPEFEAIADAKAGAKLTGNAKEFVPPFDRCDREADMRQAYEHFAPLLEKEEDA